MDGKTKRVPNDIFFNEIAEQIAIGEKVIIRAKGESMWPFIRNGSDKIVLEKPGEEGLKKGNIVLARVSDGRFVIHRIENVEKDRLVLRGDGNLGVREFCKLRDVIALATAVVRDDRTILQGSISWNCMSRLWPSGSFFRRLFLGLNRRWNRKKNSDQ